MKRLLILPLMLVAVIACDSQLSETLAWMDNTYNPHKDAEVNGHGHTAWYAPNQSGNDVEVSGSTETFTHDGCQMDLHIQDDHIAGREVYISISYTFNLRDIDPKTIKMSTFSHIGGWRCENYDAEQRRLMNLDCDHAEITFSTHEGAPLINEKWDTVYVNLQGSDHENKSSNKGTRGYFEINDLAYARRFAKAFRHAVKLCGGKPEPFE